jgi:uncharacterized protein YkwD
MDARRRLSHRGRLYRLRFLRWFLTAAGVLSCALVVLELCVRTPFVTGTGQIRLVLSSSNAAAPAGRASTTALYAKHDPWKKYLASETACPGGERTDLPPKSQIKTVSCLVNFARRRRGLRELALASLLDLASARKAEDILRCGRFGHNPCGGDWTTSVKSTGYVGAFGENLYLASGPFAAPRPAVDAWLNSTPHRENLFGAKWRAQGLAVVTLSRFDGNEDVAVWVNVLGDSGL